MADGARSADVNRRVAIAIEGLLLLAVIASVINTAVWFFSHGYLPHPYIYDTNDTFMDWFNPAYWANHPGAYDVWRSVYPPVSFVFLKLFSLGACYRDSPFFGRDCDWLGRAAIFGFYCLNIVLIYLCYRTVDLQTALMRTVAMAIGLPMLFTLERGNLILPCMTFFILGHSRLLRSARLRWLAIGMSINFKPYLALSVAPLLFRHRWRWLEGCLLATILVYLASFAIEGGGSPFELFSNTRDWSSIVTERYWNVVYYGTSYLPVVAALTGRFSLMSFIGSRTMEVVSVVLPLLIRAGQLGTLACFIGVWFRPNAAATHRLAALGLAMLLTSTSPGGYVEVFLLFLVFFEPWRGPARIIALVSAYLLSLSADHMLVAIAQGVGNSWLGGRSVYAVFGLTVGQLVRPGLLLVLQYALVAGTLSDLWRARPAREPLFAEGPAKAPASA